MGVGDVEVEYGPCRGGSCGVDPYAVLGHAARGLAGIGDFEVYHVRGGRYRERETGRAIKLPEGYRDVDQLIPNLLGEVGLSFLADYIKIDALDLVKVAFKTSEGGGSFHGITEVSVSMNGENALLATPGNGISPTEIVLQPDNPIGLLAFLQDCPAMTGALRGTVPLDPPTRWDNLITLHLKARVGFL